MALLPCPSCGGFFRDIEGPTHAYMTSSPGCWAAFGRVLARGFEDANHFGTHRLVVDAYAVQHPGQPSRQSIQSVGVHLVRLCLFLEHGLTPEHANRTMLAAAKRKASYVWLTPPASLGELTIADVEAATSPGAHADAVGRWSRQMWQVWSTHHDMIRRWAQLA